MSYVAFSFLWISLLIPSVLSQSLKGHHNEENSNRRLSEQLRVSTVKEKNVIKLNPKEDLFVEQDRSVNEISTGNKLELSFSQIYIGGSITKINQYQVKGYEEMMRNYVLSKKK